MSGVFPDPWSIDYFNPTVPQRNPSVIGEKPFDPIHPTQRRKTPRLLPQMNLLFNVQRDALKTLNAIGVLRDAIAKEGKGQIPRHVETELHRVEREAENTYRVIRSYLKEYSGE